MRFKKIYFIALIISVISTSCNKYLDIVPDNVATLENAFTMRNQAEKYLFTCYSYMPSLSNPNSSTHLMGDELWAVYPHNESQPWRIARGEQNISNPIANYWDGGLSGVDLYAAIRDCNIFLENVDRVPDMQADEKERWKAEVKFLKAYYNFFLVNLYGPIPLVKVNMPITATLEEIRVKRQPVDECFSYIEELINEAIPVLPYVIENRSSEMGRITQAIAMSFKAKVLTTAASPLFNGNRDYANFLNKEGVPYFNQTPDLEKWKKAADAAKEAINFCHQAGHILYRYPQPLGQSALSASTLNQMSIRNAVAERWNSEVIWADPNNLPPQVQFTPRTWDPAKSHTSVTGRYGPPLKIVELFYSKNGVPINEDVTWNYANRKQLRVAVASEKNNIKTGYATVGLNFDREDRFYGSLGFDGGIWYGQGKLDENDVWSIEGKMGQAAGIVNNQFYSPTGYWAKKLVNFQNTIEVASYASQWYPWPVMRLADLYLLYAEALNEFSGPSADVYEYINRVRVRSGLGTVQSSWTNFSRLPNKYATQTGLREIIQQERSIELMFEGHRYNDLRRWKTALVELNKPIKGWDLLQTDAATYYREKMLLDQTFRQADYLWPIAERNIIVNRNLDQNPGW